ncbi:hypothetical protein K2Z83_13485 [Oscillochloris sp. ZM17-4]|uniref:hypothetical protein n=1 Tax=Oscillochloris sp. ZM17-4 TaxID=2866714 RepID=UPI001C731344|nr:hypothetical protein [Oscillochloris sp. ZM17-4]MBX0328689.1 hypothetical protein [Oscillochloris sp. ZM17-4]
MSDAATFYTVITTINQAQIRQPDFNAMARVRQDGMAEAARRCPGASAQLISVTMSDSLAPAWGGLTVLSRWRLAAALSPLAADEGVA